MSDSLVANLAIYELSFRVPLSSVVQFSINSPKLRNSALTK
jgi:hypothetical protein